MSSAKAADLRRFLSRHAKSNGIDAQTLARLPLVAPESVEPVELPGAARATLDRRVRAVARLKLAAVYYAQMTTRNAPHLKAVCVVAARLAERSWVTLADGQPYQLRDVDGIPVTAEQAKQIIAERYTVPPEVRRRRRSGKQTGKIPQQPPRGAKSQPPAGHEATFPIPTVPDWRRTVKQPS